MLTLLFLAMDPTAFNLFGISIQWYAVLIGIGAFLGYLLFKAEAQRMSISEDMILDLVFWAILLGFIGARLYYVIFKWDYYSLNLDQILNIRGGGMAIYGGVLAGLASLWWMTKKNHIPLLNVLDAASPAMLLAQAIGRWGNFVNQEAYGEPVDRLFLQNLFLPDWIIDQMKIDGIYHHPTFLYESAWNIIGFLLLLILRRRQGMLLRGEPAVFYLIWYGIGRAFIEGMRTDSLYLGPFRVSQWLSVILIIFGIALRIYGRRHKYPFYLEQMK